MNKSTWLVVSFAVLLLVTEASTQDKRRVYEVPSAHVSMLLVSDPNSPIQISNPRFLKYEKGTHEKVYKLTNVSDKEVVRFQIKEISWLGGQENTKDSTLVKGQLFLPQESFSTLNNEDRLEFVPFNEKVLLDQHSQGRPKDIWIVIVTKVEMSDGTVYDISLKYKDIEKFVEKLGVNVDDSAADILAKETQLKEFIARKFDGT